MANKITNDPTYKRLFEEYLEARRQADEASNWPRSDTNPRPIICVSPCETEEDMMGDADRLERWAALQEAARLAWAKPRAFEADWYGYDRFTTA